MSFPTAAFDGEVEYTKESGGVALIRLNAPDRMNTMSPRMNAGVQVALDMAAEDTDVRCVVLTGTGTRAFCAGGQLGNERDGAATGFLGKAGDLLPPTASAAIRTLRSGSTRRRVRTRDSQITCNR